MAAPTVALPKQCGRRHCWACALHSPALTGIAVCTAPKQWLPLRASPASSAWQWVWAEEAHRVARIRSSRRAWVELLLEVIAGLPPPSQRQGSTAWSFEISFGGASSRMRRVAERLERTRNVTHLLAEYRRPILRAGKAWAEPLRRPANWTHRWIYRRETSVSSELDGGGIHCAWSHFSQNYAVD